MFGRWGKASENSLPSSFPLFYSSSRPASLYSTSSYLCFQPITLAFILWDSAEHINDKTHDGSSENDNEDNDDDDGKCHSFLLCSKYLACFCLSPLPLHAMKSFTISI